MKTIILILLATVSIANAHLIDIIEFDTSQPFPQEWFTFVQREASNRITFFDSATPAGWVSMFGALDGGTYFFTSLIGNPGPTTNVSWDFSTLSGYSMSVLLVEGSGWIHLYGVGGNFDDVDLGDQVTLHDGLDISSLAFYGRNPDSAPVPDTGSTLAMMGIGLLGLFGFARRVRA